MKFLKLLLAGFSFSILFGCAFRSVSPAQNEANRPLFYTSHHLELGAQVRALHGGETKDSSLHGEFLPLLRMSVNVNRWSSYNFLPVNWNFLLSGVQHQDSFSLKVNTLHAVLTGGLTGIQYSSLEGLELPADIHLRGKYLFTPKIFSTASVGISTDGLVSGHGSTLDGAISLGYQAWNPTSLSLDLELDREQIHSGWWKDRDDIAYRDGDASLYTGLSVKTYPTPHHIMELRGGYRTKNPASTAVGQPVARITYNYAF